MISKKYKLSRADFAKIKENTILQKRTSVGNFIIFKEDFKKFGIIISKKIVKKAHDRNKFKRLYFNIIKENLSLLPGLLLYLSGVKDLKTFRLQLNQELDILMETYKK